MRIKPSDEKALQNIREYIRRNAKKAARKPGSRQAVLRRGDKCVCAGCGKNHGKISVLCLDPPLCSRHTGCKSRRPRRRLTSTKYPAQCGETVRTRGRASRPRSVRSGRRCGSSCASSPSSTRFMSHLGHALGPRGAPSRLLELYIS